MHTFVNFTHFSLLFLCQLSMTALSFNVPSIITLLASLLSVLLAIALLRQRSKKPANLWLALLLIAVAYHLLEYSMAISANTLLFPHLLATSYPLLFAIAPLFMMYIHEAYGFVKNRKWWLHFIPSMLCLLAFIPFYLQNADAKRSMIESLAQADGLQVPIEQMIMMLVQAIQMLVYALITYRFAHKQRLALINKISNGSLIQIRWLHLAARAFLALCILIALTTVFAFSIKQHNVDIDYLSLLALSLLVVAMALGVISQPSVITQSLQKIDRVIDNAENDEQIWEQLNEQMRTQKPFLQEDLNIETLANQLDIPSYKLSSVINKKWKGTYFDYINTHRVNEAKAILSNPEQNHLKILAVAIDSGFTNKATFNRVFKKYTHSTPSAFRKEQQSS